MKKVFIVCIALFTAVVAGHAQFFIEGNVGVSSSEDKITVGKITHNRSSDLFFSVSPKAGYWLNERIAVGIGLSYIGQAADNQIISQNNPEQETGVKGTHSLFGFSVFGRYQLYRMQKFSVLVECAVDMSGGGNKNTSESVTKKTQSETLFGINVFPLLSYDLTDRFSLITTCDFLSLGFNSHTVKSEESDLKMTANNWGLNAQSSVFDNLSDISIGFIYKF